MEKITERIDAVTAIPEEYRKAVCPPPKSVKIELTSRCDLRCYFCATGQNLRAKRDIDFEFLKRILKDMRGAGVEEIGMFYLGESMLYKQLPDAIRYASELGYPYIFLTTNGRMATASNVYECVRAGLNSLKFSLNAHDKDAYKKVTGVDAFEQVVINIINARDVVEQVFRETGHRCKLYASSILFDAEQEERMRPLLEKVKPHLDEHYWLPLYNQAGLIKYGEDKKQVAGNIGRIGALRDSLPCWACFTEGHITEDGKLSACCFDHNATFTMGDLTTTSFMECWNSEVFQKLRAAHLNKNIKGTPCVECLAWK